MAKGLKIGAALPQIFNRVYPVLEPHSQLLLGVSLLRFHQIDALPIEFKKAQKKYAVFGYSCLSKLLETDSRDYGKFLEQPSEQVALELSSVPAESDIETLLKVIKKTRFGFSWVEGKHETGGFASLRDILELYAKSDIETDLVVGDVASPIVSLPKESTVKQALTDMFARRFRRVFVGDKVISDRRIIGYIFSPSRLNEISKNPETLLDAKLGDLEGMRPAKVSSKLSIKKASNTLGGEVEECLICEKGVITPWDMVMKPWIDGKLKISR